MFLIILLALYLLPGAYVGTWNVHQERQRPPSEVTASRWFIFVSCMLFWLPLIIFVSRSRPPFFKNPLLSFDPTMQRVHTENRRMDEEERIAEALLNLDKRYLAHRIGMEKVEEQRNAFRDASSTRELEAAGILPKGKDLDMCPECQVLHDGRVYGKHHKESCELYLSY